MEANENPEVVEATEATLFSELFHNIPRHNLITKAAKGLLTAEAAQQIRTIITPLNFASFGGWADEIKKTTPPDDAETTRFLNDLRNRQHRQWHYVNLPLGCESYRQAKQMGFTRDNDVIQTIRTCVSVLKGDSDRFSRVNALRLIGHLVGDVHQPLHIGCGFIDESGSVPRLETDPDTIRQRNLRSDTGGNDLMLPGSGNMHSYWDGKLGGDIDIDDITPSNMPSRANAADAGGAETASASLEAAEDAEAEKLRARAEQLGGGGGANLSNALPVERWAETWAGESLRASSEAYRNIEIVGRQGEGFKVSWEGKTTSAGKAPYDARCSPVLLERMTVGVRNMADLLNEIFQ